MKEAQGGSILDIRGRDQEIKCLCDQDRSDTEKLTYFLNEMKQTCVSLARLKVLEPLVLVPKHPSSLIHNMLRILNCICNCVLLSH